MVSKTCDLVARLQTIPDPRRQCRNLKHRLVDILVLGFCGTLTGCDDFVELADWVADNADILGTFLELPNGIPSHDTFGRVFAALDPVAFEQCFLAFVRDLVPDLAGERIAIDGKVLRGAHASADPSHPLRLVSAWAAGARLRQHGSTQTPLRS